MPISEEVIREIKYRNDIESVINSYVNLKRRGKNLIGLCPFHNEKTPSFTVYPESGSFYCFGCGVGGDVFTFTKLIENLDYMEAVKLLAERSGVELPQDGYDDSMQRLRNTVYEINRETARFYHSYLMSPSGKWCLDYYLSRGLTLNTIKHFGLGAAPDSWDALKKHLESKGFSVYDMLQANVIGKSNHGTYYDRFRKRAMFPIINIRGRVIAFSGRAMPGEDKAGGKYVNTSDTPVYKKSENLFGMNFAKNCCEERVILVEGNMDVISLHQAGFQNTVAALGTSFTAEQARLLTKYTKEIVLTLDADAAGQKAVRRAGEILKDTGLNVRVVVIPDAKDPDEFIKKQGVARFSALIEGARSELEYRLLTAAQGIETESDDGRLQYLKAAAEILATVPDRLTRDLYIGQLSDKYGVSRTAITDRVETVRKSLVKQREKKEISNLITPRYDSTDINPERRQYPAAAKAEESVIAVLFRHPDLIETARNSMPPDKVLTALNRRIYTKILEIADSGRDPDISYFGEGFSSAEMGYLVSLVNGEKGKKNALTVLKDSIKVILDENMFGKTVDVKGMSVEDWAENMKKIIENKKGK